MFKTRFNPITCESITKQQVSDNILTRLSQSRSLGFLLRAQKLDLWASLYTNKFVSLIPSVLALVQCNISIQVRLQYRKTNPMKRAKLKRSDLMNLWTPSLFQTQLFSTYFNTSHHYLNSPASEPAVLMNTLSGIVNLRWFPGFALRISYWA